VSPFHFSGDISYELLSYTLLAAVLLCRALLTAQSDTPELPEANPGRPTVSTPATLTPVGYLQFENRGAVRQQLARILNEAWHQSSHQVHGHLASSTAGALGAIHAQHRRSGKR